MAVYTTGITLKDAGFPLISRWAGKPALIRNTDVASLEARAPTEQQTDYFNSVNKPQVIYCENVLPKLGGVVSVGYVTIAAAILGAGAKQAFTMRMHTLATGADLTDVLIWLKAPNVEYKTAAAHGTVALPAAYPAPTHVAALEPGDGAYFLLSDGVTSTLYDFGMTAGVPSFSALVLTGIAAGDLNDCRFACAAGNYFILAKEDGTIFWNDPNNLLDFTPSLTTGAGSQVPVCLYGTVTGVFSWGDGFIIHTTAGCVVARYSNNAQTPWQFSAVTGSSATQQSAITNKLAATVQEFDAVQYAWTAAGLQQATVLQGAQGIFPDVGDFLASELLENLVAGLPTIEYPPATSVTEQVDVMVSRMGPRYLVISYGRRLAAAAYFTYALIYDMQLRRWGKLKVDHYEAVYLPPAISGAETLRQLGFVDIAGNILMTYEESTFEGTPVVHNATVIVGGVSLVRGNASQFNTVEINFGEDSPSITVKHSSAADGINYNAFTALERIASNIGTATYAGRKIGMYHAISVNGKFNISAFQLDIRKAGNR